MSDRVPTTQFTGLPQDVRPAKGVFAKAVGSFVPKVTATVFQKFGFHSAEIMSSWATIVGAELARLTRPESIKWPRGGKAQVDADEEDSRNTGATLIVATDPAFALEVSYRHKEIIDRINRYFGYRAIAQIKVHQVPRFAEPIAAKDLAPKRMANEHKAAGTGDLAAALEELGRSVAADRLR
ncbi:MAG TPA: DciA family protein [Hyphomicrobium sp.]|nr:DciA family protein [Hyphomicrobium sp.]